MNPEFSLEHVWELLPFLYSEGILVAGIMVLTLFALFRRIPWQVNFLCTALIVVAAAWTAWHTQTYSHPLFSLSVSGNAWKLLLDISVLVILLFKHNRHLRSKSAEYLMLVLLLLLGGHFLVMSNNLFTTYLAIEVLSLSGYMLVALPVLRAQVIASFRYLIFGAVASATLIYGMSLYYGLNGTLSLMPVAEGDTLGLLAALLITFGIFFKISAAPFHFWVPDVYEGSSYPVLGLVAIVPKIAAFSFLVSWIDVIPGALEIVGSLALVTLLAGNLGALAQSNVRRMMGFSAIAHTGFMMLALFYSSEYLYFYAVVYALMTLGVFHLLNGFLEKYQIDTLDAFTGMRRVSPVKTLFILIWMVALTGLPPTAGFTSKLLVFTGLGELYASGGSVFLLILLGVGILNAVVSLGYYIKIPYFMIFKTPAELDCPKENMWSFANLLGTILVLLVLLLFIWPEWLMSWLNNINFAQ